MRAKAGELKAGWSHRERDIQFAWGEGTERADGRLLHTTLCTTYQRERAFIDELEARGYDLTTLRFSIKRKALQPAAEGGEGK